MRQHNAENERVKREYLIYLKAAKGLSEASLDTVAKAIHRFEVSTKLRAFRKFHVEQAVAFRRQLSESDSSETGKPLSKATVEEALRKLLAGTMSDQELPAKVDEDQPIATEDDPAGEDAGAYGGIIEGLKRVLELRKLAGDEAARAAPYVHPRQGYVGVEQTPGDEEIPLAERLAYYQRRDDLKAAGDKVIELNSQSDQGADPSGSEPIPPPLS
jgi:hypothetical protein